MNLLNKLGLFLISGFITFTLQAQNEVLKIGVEPFSPPFVSVGAGNHIYGFDADMIQILCKKMQATCQFQTMFFDELIENTASGKVDMALSAIAITADRLKRVNFSLPYLMIYHRFLTNKEIAKQPFSMSVLDNKRIAYEEGTVLADRINTLPIKNPIIVPYKNIQDEIIALSEGDVDFVILDNPTALYWQNNASAGLRTFGDPLPSKYGLGIALTPQKPELITLVNRALIEYLNDGGFTENFNKYLAPFENPESGLNAKP